MSSRPGGTLRRPAGSVSRPCHRPALAPHFPEVLGWGTSCCSAAPAGAWALPSSLGSACLSQGLPRLPLQGSGARATPTGPGAAGEGQHPRAAAPLGKTATLKATGPGTARVHECPCPWVKGWSQPLGQVRAVNLQEGPREGVGAGGRALEGTWHPGPFPSLATTR